jgi:TctA family transporter
MSTSNVIAAASSAAGASGAAAMLVLGIPLGALIAALLGAGLAYVARGREPDEQIPARLLGILMDAFIGGWIAVALVRLIPLHRYGIDAIPLEAIAGLIALFWRGLRIWIPSKADQAFTAVLDTWFRGRSGGAP